MTTIPRPARRLLHTSDLHLESLHHKSYLEFTAMINAAEHTNPDVIIIAGDLFDSDRVTDDLVTIVVEALKKLRACVVILPGNHDCLNPGSAYRRSEIWCENTNITVFKSPTGDTVNYSKLGIMLWGKPLMSYEEEIIPLKGLPRPEGKGMWNIAVAHGSYIGTDDPYAAGGQITLREIASSGFNYIALGHVPVYKIVCREPVVACYSGSPAAGCLIVDLSEETGVTLSRYAETTGLKRVSSIIKDGA